MHKTAFLFPGQGTQYVGMGKDFYDTYDICKKTFQMASKASGLKVEQICFTENEQIDITEHTQVAMLATEAVQAAGRQLTAAGV